MRYTKKIRLALVHDDFIQNGGAEKLFFKIIQQYNKDPDFELRVFSSLISKEWKHKFRQEGVKINESFLAKIPGAYKIHKFFFFLDWFYLAFQSFDFSDYNVVLSSSTRFGQSIVTKPSTFHISYLNSPSRPLWSEKKYFYGKKFSYFLLKNFLPNKRIFDFYSQCNADLIISNSKNIKKKVLKFYRRKSLVLFPFIDLPNEKGKLREGKSDYFLLISRLEGWKRIDYVLETFNLNQKKLIIVGTGSALKYYQKISGPNIEFKGYITEDEKISLLNNAKGLIFPQDEDFGLTILEALHYNCPVVYYNKGGAKEILNIKVGVGFSSQNSAALNNAIKILDNFNFDQREKDLILQRYSKKNFLKFLKKLILNKTNKFSSIIKKNV